jgi:hypothetical protein
VTLGTEMPAIEKQYEYKPKWTTVLLCGGFFGLCTAFFVSLVRDLGGFGQEVEVTSPAAAF